MSGHRVPTVAVVGSVNLDIVVTLDRVPARGETVFGTDYSEAHGGKGANQAIGAGRRVPTALIAAVGTDTAGGAALKHLADRRVTVKHVTQQPVPTGRAFITVTPDGENAITVLPLANSLLTADTVTTALDDIRPAAVLAQRETPDETVHAAAEWCRDHGARFILNASPIAPVSQFLLTIADPLIVNEEEALGILKITADDQVPLKRVAAQLGSLTASAILTAGSDGAYVVQAGTVTRVPATRVDPVDTTGAGDEFAGTLAAELAQRTPLIEAAIQAGEASAALIQVPRDDR
ncbi:ribokinase [Frondihabitans australicus]|uniref:Ribokinase n=1 Tax=Frondihabitans australicus TaxID=386892 RepID=A0A495IIK8_9MICO|nr:ribokinase [Frondihabitans australicus]RKR75872.1 ribokinase [Frondihabitans australicus]